MKCPGDRAAEHSATIFAPGTVLEYERPLDPLDEDYEVNRG